MWLFIRALHPPRGLKSDDVIQGARRQKSQVDSGTSGGAALLSSSQIATAASFLLGNGRRTGTGRGDSSSLGTAKRVLAVKKSVF